MDKNGHKASTSNRSALPPELKRIELPEKKSGTNPSFLYLLIGFIALGGAVALIMYGQSQRQSDLAATTQSMIVPTVQVVHPELGAGEVRVTLPGTVQAYMETPIYARVDGYLKRWLVDIGSKVTKGQLLAEIETPEVDQQLIQAQATMNQAEVDLKLAQSTAQRWKVMLADHTVSQQEYDEKNGDFESKAANLKAASANVIRLLDLQSFKSITAPFDGVLTARNVDVGNLINSGSGSTTKELFRVAQTNVLRIYVNIPEYLSSMVSPGTLATIEMASAPSKKVTGKLVRTSGAIDPTSLTLLAELNVDNADGSLLPGGYAQVHFDLASKNSPLLVPSNTLIFRASGTQVAVVDPDSGLVHLVNIHLGRDFGTKLEVVDGLKNGDSVILNPSDSLTDGSKVIIGK